MLFMKKGTKILGLFVLGLFVISLLASFVGATDLTPQAKALGQSTITGLTGFFQGALAPLYNPSDGGWMIKILMGLLLGMIIYSVVISFGGSTMVTTIISAIITIISILAMPAGLLSAISTSYGAMGTTILMIIPFAIILIFSVRVGSLLIGRLAWIFFCLYYFFLLIYNWAINPVATLISTESLPYWGGIIAGLLAFFLLGAIRKAIFKGEMDAINESGVKMIKEGSLLRKLKHKDLHEVYGVEDTGN
jgi:hypothetical protein